MPRHLPRTLRRPLAGAALGALIAAPGAALAQEAGADARADAGQELDAGTSDAFEFEPVTEGDFDEGSAYRRRGADGDGRLSDSDDEFSTGSSTGSSGGSFRGLDGNADGRLDDNEFPRPRTLGSGRDYPGLQGARGGGGVGRDPGIGTGGLEGTSGPGGAGGSGIGLGGNGAGDM